MSKSTVIKEQIMEILRDNREHTASDIKVTIRKKYPDMDITEGVFSFSPSSFCAASGSTFLLSEFSKVEGRI